MKRSVWKITRRRLLCGAIASSALELSGIRSAFSQEPIPFKLHPLPYSSDALAPVISGETIEFHYGKHHKGYVDNLNRLVKGTEFSGLPLEEIVKKTVGNIAQIGIYNNAAQAWNHAFYWNSMRQKGGGLPTGKLAVKIKDSFGDYTVFREQFITAATTQFGSGWAWLVQDEGDKLKILKTANADTPLLQGMKCLLTCDVWEHAYYLDYQNRRRDYVEAWLDKLVNWDFVHKQMAL
jgi:superoxide dismutase, Fe-Mn family